MTGIYQQKGIQAMKVLVFSPYFTPEIAASMYLFEDIFRCITERGHTVELYVPTPTRGVDRETRKTYKNKKTELRHGGKMVIRRIAMYREGKNAILRAIRYVLVNIACIWKGLRTSGDIIFAPSTPPTQGMMINIIGRLKHIPTVYNVQDVFPDSMVNNGMTRKGSILWKIGRKIENYSYSRAKHIIVISEDFKNNLLEKKVPEEKITVIPNWADLSGIHPVPREENILISRYQLDPSCFYVTYSGNIGLSQNMDLLLEAAKMLEHEISELRFLIIGDGADRERVQARIADEKISNVIMLPFQPYEDIAHVFSLGDIGLIISKPGIGGSSVPSKTFNILAASRPILASFDRESELCQLIDKYHCGMVAEADSLDEFVSGIRALYSNPEIRRQLGQNGRQYVSDNLGYQKPANQYVDVLENNAKNVR